MAVVKKRIPGAVPKKKVSADTGMPAIELPTRRSTPVTDLARYVLLIYGAKKIGKTTLAAHFRNALFMMYEAGGKALSIFQLPVRNWRETRAVTTKLKTDTRFDTVVVDLVDLAFKACETHICTKMGIEHPSEEDWGRGYSAVRDEFTRWLADLSNTGKGIILISHSTEREIKTKSGRKYDRVQPTMSGQARDIIEGFVDIWAYYDYDDDRRVLTIRGDEHVLAGHRLDQHFMWKGKEVKAIDMGTSSKDGYANFVACFNNAYAPPVSASDESTAAPTVVKKRRVVA